VDSSTLFIFRKIFYEWTILNFLMSIVFILNMGCSLADAENTKPSKVEAENQKSKE